MAYLSQVKLGNSTYDISAIKLKNARTIQTNLASVSSASFDGTANITPGVTGVLGIGNGGTGANNRKTAITNLGVFGLYERNDIGTSPNFDNPGVNGLFELRSKSETTGETGIKPYDGFGPFISLKYSNTMFQLAGTNANGFYIRGKQAANVTLAGVNWQKLLTSGNYTDYTVTKTGSGASGTWGINISGNAATATKLTSSGGSSLIPVYFSSGKPVACTTIYSGKYFGGLTSVSSDGVMEIGKYVDFHNSNADTSDYSTRLMCTGTTGNVISLPTATGTMALTSDLAGYLPLSGGTLTGKLQVNAPIFGYNYSSGGNNVASFTWDKPGANYTGMGACGDADTIYFGACNNDGVWVTDYRQKWKFNGSLIVGGGDDNCNIVPWANNYSTIGTESLKWYRIYATNIYGDKVYGAVWNDYAEYRSQKEEIEPGYCVASSNEGKVYKTTEKFQACDGIVSDTFGFAIGETDDCKTPLAIAGRVLAYYSGNRDDYQAGDTVCAGPDGKVMKMTREEIKTYPDRIVGIVSEIPEYEIWGTGNIEVNNRIWIKIK